METIGFIGLGRMGRPMASNLCRRGFRVIVHDIDRDAVGELERLQARGAADTAEVASSSQIIVTMLPNGRIVDEVIAGSDGVFAHAKPGSLVMDMSTIDPETTDRLAAQARARGLAFVDAPVGRLASHADAGQSLFMIGASEEDLERIRPALEAMGTTIHHCGGPGSGIRTKLVNNFLAISSCQLNAEALVLAARLGLDLETTLAVIGGTSAINGQLSMNFPNKSLKGDTEPGFTIDLAHKDLGLVIDAAHEVSVPLPMGAAAFEAFSSARARGHGLSDFSAMLQAHSDLAKTPTPRLKD